MSWEGRESGTTKNTLLCSPFETQTEYYNISELWRRGLKKINKENNILLNSPYISTLNIYLL